MLPATLRAIHLAARRERGYREKRIAGAVVEEVDRLNVSGIVAASAFVEGDEDRRAGPKSRIRRHCSDDFFHEAFE